MWEDQKSQEIKGGTKANTRLISVTEITEQTSDYIAVLAEGLGGVEGRGSHYQEAQGGLLLCCTLKTSSRAPRNLRHVKGTQTRVNEKLDISQSN